MTDPWTHLANNGPSTGAELPHNPNFEARRDGVQKSDPSCRSNGGTAKSASGGMDKVPVYYIENKHPATAVIRAWLDANPNIRDRMTDTMLHHRIAVYGEDFKRASRIILDDYCPQPRNPDPSNNGYGDAECPFCGATDLPTLPDHLPKCDAAP